MGCSDCTAQKPSACWATDWPAVAFAAVCGQNDAPWPVVGEGGGVQGPPIHRAIAVLCAKHTSCCSLHATLLHIASGQGVAAFRQSLGWPWSASNLLTICTASAAVAAPMTGVLLLPPLPSNRPPASAAVNPLHPVMTTSGLWAFHAVAASCTPATAGTSKHARQCGVPLPLLLSCAVFNLPQANFMML